MTRKRVVGLGRHLLHQRAEAVDVGVVERRVDLVEHADRRGIGQEHREDQRQRRQRLLAARQQRQRRRLLAGRLGDDLEPAFQRILALDHLEPRLAAAEQSGEQPLEMPVDGVEGVVQARLCASPLIWPMAAAQLGDGLPRRRRFSLSSLSNCCAKVGEIVVGLQVDAAEALAVGLEARQLAVRRRAAAASARWLRSRPAPGSLRARHRAARGCAAPLLGARVRAFFEPRLDARARFARVGHGCLRGAQRLRRLPVAQLSAAASASAAAWRSLLGLGELGVMQLLALLLDHARRHVGELWRSRPRVSAMRCLQRGDLLAGAGTARRPALALDGDGGTAARCGRAARARA